NPWDCSRPVPCRGRNGRQTFYFCPTVARQETLWTDGEKVRQVSPANDVVTDAEFGRSTTSDRDSIGDVWRCSYRVPCSNDARIGFAREHRRRRGWPVLRGVLCSYAPCPRWLYR